MTFLHRLSELEFCMESAYLLGSLFFIHVSLFVFIKCIRCLYVCFENATLFIDVVLIGDATSGQRINPRTISPWLLLLGAYELFLVYMAS